MLFLLFLAALGLANAQCLHIETPMDCCVRTGHCEFNSSLPTLWDVASLDAKYLDDLWHYSASPSVQDFRGNLYHGIMLEVENCAAGATVVELLVGDVTKEGELRSKVLTFEKNMFDRDTGDHSGETFWPCKKSWMPFKIYESEAVKGEGYSLKIDYSVSGNNLITRPLLDEVRAIPNSNLIIGKNWYRGPVNVLTLWFAMELVSIE